MKVARNMTAAPGTATAGLVAGTTILTADGAIPVELLGRGDRVITRNTGLVTLEGISFHRQTGDFVRIAAGALSAQRPESDTVLAADQAILLRGAPAVSASGEGSCTLRAGDLPLVLRLSDGVTVLRGADMCLVRLQFQRHQIVYANGLEVLCQPEAARMLAA